MGKDMPDESFRCPSCFTVIALRKKPKPGAVYNKRCKCGDRFIVRAPEK